MAIRAQNISFRRRLGGPGSRKSDEGLQARSPRARDLATPRSQTKLDMMQCEEVSYAVY